MSIPSFVMPFATYISPQGINQRILAVAWLWAAGSAVLLAAILFSEVPNNILLRSESHLGGQSWQWYWRRDRPFDWTLNIIFIHFSLYRSCVLWVCVCIFFVRVFFTYKVLPVMFPTFAVCHFQRKELQGTYRRSLVSLCLSLSPSVSVSLSLSLSLSVSLCLCLSLYLTMINFLAMSPTFQSLQIPLLTVLSHITINQ